MSETRAREMQVIDDAEQRGRTDLWPFWRRVYAQGDPLPALACTVSRPTYRFDENELRGFVAGMKGEGRPRIDDGELKYL